MRPCRESSWKVFASHIGGGDQVGEKKSAHGFLVSICQNVSPTRDFPFQPLDKYKRKKSSSGKAKRNSFRGRKKMLRNVCRPIIRMFAAIFSTAAPIIMRSFKFLKTTQQPSKRPRGGRNATHRVLKSPRAQVWRNAFQVAAFFLFFFFSATFPPSLLMRVTLKKDHSLVE